MGDFDDITNILDDLANFDVTQFDVPQKPAPQLNKPSPFVNKPAPIQQPTFDDDFGMGGLEDFGVPSFDDNFSAPITKKPSNNNNMDFGSGIDISDSALGLDFELPPTDFDLPPTDIVIENQSGGRRAPPSRGNLLFLFISFAFFTIFYFNFPLVKNFATISFPLWRNFYYNFNN